MRTVSRCNPNSRAASRMLIPSTITALRTRRYTSTLYIHRTTRRLDFKPMDGGGRSDLQPPFCQRSPAHMVHFIAAPYSIELLIDESSGNYRIDEPFLELLFEVMAVRVEHDPVEAAETMSKPHFRLKA